MFLIWAVPGFRRITSPFGLRILNGKQDNHRGIDIGRNLSPPQPIENANIVAIADGRVTFSQFNHSGGNMIIIDHGSNIQSRYLHNAVNLVRVGEQVRQGQTIGRVGNTGQSFGAHLHLDIIINGVFVNPINYLEIESFRPGQNMPPCQIFRVQVGSFRDRANAITKANQMSAKLRASGIDSSIAYSNNKFRVQIGAFTERAAAENLRNWLRERGFDSFIVEA